MKCIYIDICEMQCYYPPNGSKKCFGFEPCKTIKFEVLTNSVDDNFEFITQKPKMIEGGN